MENCRDQVFHQKLVDVATQYSAAAEWRGSAQKAHTEQIGSRQVAWELLSLSCKEHSWLGAVASPSLRIGHASRANYYKVENEMFLKSSDFIHFTIFANVSLYFTMAICVLNMSSDFVGLKSRDKDA